MYHISEGTFDPGSLILFFFIKSIKISNLYYPQSFLQICKFPRELKSEYMENFLVQIIKSSSFNIFFS